MKRRIGFLLTCFLLPGLVYAALPLDNVPLEFTPNDLLLRWTAKGWIPVDSALSRPYPRPWLRSLLEADGEPMSRIDASLRERYRNVVSMASPDTLYEYNEGGFRLRFDPRIEADFQSFAERTGSAFEIAGRPVLYGGTDRFGFFGELKWGLVTDDRAHVYAPDEFPLRQRSFTGDVEQVSFVKGHVAFGSPHIQVQIGKIDTAWGLGQRGNLLLSTNTDAKDGVRLLVRFGPFHFESVTASMPQIGREKYVSAHRLGIRLHPRLVIGVHEAVVYTDRLELNYVNPFNLYLLSIPIVERGRRPDDPAQRAEFPGDNGFFGADVTYRAGVGILAYANLVVDDFQPQFGLSSFKNWDTKFAAQAGVYLADPFEVADSALQAEYTFVNQYTYTHEHSVLAYTLRGRPLGFWTGPDADDLWIRASKWLSPRVRASLALSQTRQGEQTIDRPHTRSDPDRWTFLSGVAEVRRVADVEIRWTDVERWRVTLRLRAGRVLHEGHDPQASRSVRDLEIRAFYRI